VQVPLAVHPPVGAGPASPVAQAFRRLKKPAQLTTKLLRFCAAVRLPAGWRSP